MPKTRVFDIRSGRRLATNPKPASVDDLHPSEAVSELMALRQWRKRLDALWLKLEWLESAYEDELRNVRPARDPAV